jgi:hypothetical protein
LRLPKMTTRRLMIVVAALAMLLGGAVLGQRLMRRRAYYLRHAAGYAEQERNFRHGPRGVWDYRMNEQECDSETLADKCAEMKTIYLHAASRPWTSVPPYLPDVEIYHLSARVANFDRLRKEEADDAWNAAYGDY